MAIKDFFKKNMVFLVGLLMALMTAGSDIYENGSHPSWWVIFWSLFIAGLSYLGRNIRGQWASIVGIVVTTGAAFYSLHDTPNGITLHVFMKDLLIPIGLALSSVFWSTPAKSVGYERTDIIKEAKQEGEIVIPTMAKPKP